MILLWGLERDAPLRAVREELEHLGAPTVFFDQRATAGNGVELHTNGRISGCLLVGGREFDLDSVTAAYLRPYDCRRLPGVRRAGPESPEWDHALLCSELLWAWADLAPAVVVNRPTAMASNFSKPYQARLIRAVGFHVPETLITTDPAAAKEFAARHDAVVYKSVSSVRSVVSRLSADRLDALDAVASCPTQFQEYVAGVDFRVHVVGGDVFASRVVSTADDYRYAHRQGGTVEVHADAVPPECASRCVAVAHSLELAVAGVDLRVTPDGRWYCFEVNASPAFTYHDRGEDRPVARAVARLLALEA